jgi:hypothetical protein
MAVPAGLPGSLTTGRNFRQPDIKKDLGCGRKDFQLQLVWRTEERRVCLAHLLDRRIFYNSAVVESTLYLSTSKESNLCLHSCVSVSI